MARFLDEIHQNRQAIDILTMNFDKLQRCYIRKFGVHARLRGLYER